MGTILGTTIEAKIRADVFDTGEDRFTDATILSWLNEGQKMAAILKPDVNITTTAVQLAEGTKQSLGTGAIGLKEITRNMGTDGSTPGAPVYAVDMDRFARRNRNWYAADASATVQVYMYDPENPLVFFVYPPQPSSSQGYVEMVRQMLPTNITGIGNAINIGDEYEAALYQYGMYRAHMVDAKHSANALQKAMTHLNQFYTILGRMDLVEWRISRKISKEAKQQ